MIAKGIERVIFYLMKVKGVRGATYLDSSRDVRSVKMSVGEIFITGSGIFINGFKHIILGRKGEPEVQTFSAGMRMVKMKVGDEVQIQSVGSRENPRGVRAVNVRKDVQE